MRSYYRIDRPGGGSVYLETDNEGPPETEGNVTILDADEFAAAVAQGATDRKAAILARADEADAARVALRKQRYDALIAAGLSGAAAAAISEYTEGETP